MLTLYCLLHLIICISMKNKKKQRQKYIISLLTPCVAWQLVVGVPLYLMVRYLKMVYFIDKKPGSAKNKKW